MPPYVRMEGEEVDEDFERGYNEGLAFGEQEGAGEVDERLLYPVADSSPYGYSEADTEAERKEKSEKDSYIRGWWEGFYEGQRLWCQKLL